jgi:hypothetical protein
MFYYLDIETINGTHRHIFQPLTNGGVMSFPLTNDNPNKAAYDAWVAEGNTAEEWSPDAT